MATITYPVGVLLDNSGVPLTSAATVTISTVLNPLTGVAISTPGATVNTNCLPFVSVSYDAQAHGEAVITLAVSQTGRIITGVNASPIIYCAVDSSLIDTALPNAAPGSANGLPTVNASNQVALNTSQTLPATASLVVGSTGEALAAARAAAIGKRIYTPITINSATTSLYGQDNTLLITQNVTIDASGNAILVQ